MLMCFLPAHSFMSEEEAICDIGSGITGNWDNATNKVGKHR